MGKKGPLTWVTPKEFKERTSLTFSSRSETTQRLDAAYTAFHFGQTELKRKQLYDVLREYLIAHGGYWNKCERNTVSGGLLEWMYNELAPPAVRMTPAKARALDARADKLINDFEIPHSRFGVLYLLGNINLQGDWTAMAIEGVAVAGSAVAVGVGTDYGQLKDAGKAAKTAFTVAGQKVTYAAAASGGAVVMTIPQTALGVGGSVKAKTLPEAPTPDAFPCSAKVLGTAASAISDAYDHNKFLGILAGAGVTAITIPAAVGAIAADGLYNLYRLGKWLYDKITGAIKSVINLLRSKWNDGTTWVSEKFGMVLKLATKFVIDMVFKQAAPLVGSLIDLGTGIVRAVDAACTRIASYLDRKKIRLQPGHPEETANSIEHAMNMGIFRGLADVLKGAGKTAVAVTLPGLGSLVSALMSAIEWLVKFLYRYFESERIDKFLFKARELWKAEQAKMYKAALAKPPKVAPGDKPHLQPVIDGTGILCDTAEFTAFFKEGCDASPIIPMLTLNSGICGSLMTLVKLFDGGGDKPVTLARNPGGRQPFDVAGNYFNRLKIFSSEYLRACGFQFQPLNDNDDYIRGLLTHAVQKHRAPLTFGRKVLAIAKA